MVDGCSISDVDPICARRGLARGDRSADRGGRANASLRRNLDRGHQQHRRRAVNFHRRGGGCIAREGFASGARRERVVRSSLDQIWHPRAVIVNEGNSVSRKFPDMTEVEPYGRVIYRQRYAGAFTQPLRLRSFPFDVKPRA